MNSDFNLNLQRDDVSCNPFKNNKKLRVGIILDDYHLETWKYTILKTIARSDYASIELGIFNKKRNHEKSGKIWPNPQKLLYTAYTGLENRITQHKLDAFKQINTEKLFENIPKIELQRGMDTSSDFSNDDVQQIKKFNLDVIIQCGFQNLKGDILNAAKYGIWSYLYCDNIKVRGGPPGFWETFEIMGDRGVILQILTEDEENGIELYHSIFGCDSLVVKRNNNNCYLKSSLFVPRTLKKLFTMGEEAFFKSLKNNDKKFNFYNYKLYSTPTSIKFFTMLLKQFYRMGIKQIQGKFTRNQWMLMYNLTDQLSTSFWRFKKIIPPSDRFYADPHVFFLDDTYYIFIEEFLFEKKKGHISLIEMQQSGKYSDPVKVLEEPFHLSYPHVFEHKGTLFMIPETQKADSINLYECTNFPTEWVHRKILIDSVDAVDSTIVFHKNKWWLFTNIAEPKRTANNELCLFYSDNLLSSDWHSHPMNPVISDVNRARSGGKIFQQNGTLYRPSQCGIPVYGYGLKLNEIITLSENNYQEREIAFIEPRWDKKLKGIHTLCRENRLTMIDGNYHKFFL